MYKKNMKLKFKHALILMGVLILTAVVYNKCDAQSGKMSYLQNDNIEIVAKNMTVYDSTVEVRAQVSFFLRPSVDIVAVSITTDNTATQFRSAVIDKERVKKIGDLYRLSNGVIILLKFTHEVEIYTTNNSGHTVKILLKDITDIRKNGIYYRKGGVKTYYDGLNYYTADGN